jgi:anti-sigma factor RsiW
MDCQQACNLFDAYLDGELGRALATELDAHRLQCPACRQELALLEVAGHVITGEPEPPQGLRDDFSDRLLACVQTPRVRSAARLRRPIFIGAAVLAAAASVAIIVSLSRTPTPQVAGKKVVREIVPADPTLDQAADALVQQVDSVWSTRHDSANSLIELGQLTLTQFLERLGANDDIDFEPNGDLESESLDDLTPSVEQNVHSEDDLEDL